MLAGFILLSQNANSSYVKTADTVNRIIGIDKETGKAKIGLKVGSDTAWMVWDGTILNFISDTLKHNGELIGGGSGVGTLQEVTDLGSTTTNDVNFLGEIYNSGVTSAASSDSIAALVNNKIVKIPIPSITGSVGTLQQVTDNGDSTSHTIKADTYKGSNMLDINMIGGFTRVKNVIRNEQDSVFVLTDLDYLDPLMYAAIGDGVNDDSPELQAFFDDMVTYGIPGRLLSDKVYYVSEPITVAPSEKGFYLDGNGSWMVMDYADWATDDAILQIEQPAIYTKTLDANVEQNSYIVIVTDATGVEPGMGIRIDGTELEQFYQVGSSHFSASIMSKVQKVSNDTIWMETMAPFEITTADNAAAIQPGVKIFNNNDIIIENLKLKPIGNIASAPSSAANVLFLKNLYEPVIRNIQIDSGLYMTFKIKGMYGGLMDNINVNWADDSWGSNYGLAYEALINTNIINSKFSAFSTGTTSSKFLSYDLTFNNCTFSNSVTTADVGFTGAGYDSHGDLQVKLIDCDVYTANINAGQYEFINCNLYAKTYSVSVLKIEEGARHGNTRLIVRGCNIYNGTGENAYFVKTTDPDVNNAENFYLFENNVFMGDDIVFEPNMYHNYKDNYVKVDSLDYYRLPNRTDQNGHFTNYDGFSGNQIATSASIANATSMSGIFLVKDTALSANQTMMGVDGGSYRLWFQKQSNRYFSIRYTNEGDIEKEVDITLPSGFLKDAWNVWGFVLTGSKYILYWDGKPVAQADLPITDFEDAGGRNITIGAVDNASVWLSDISKAIVFKDVALTAKQMAEYTNDMKLGAYNSTIGLLDYKTTGTWYDESGNGNDGTVASGIDLKDLENITAKEIYSTGNAVIGGGLLKVEPLASDPALAVPDGYMWFNSTDETFNIQIGGSTYTLNRTIKP